MKTISNKIQGKQEGIALVMALIMLLLITVIGVASVRMSTNDTQISGNSMYSLMVFQGAESTLGKVASINDYYNISNAADRGTQPFKVADSYFQPVELVNNGAKLISEAEMNFELAIKGAPVGNIPNSSDFEYQIFRTKATSRLDATSARATHIEGIAVQSASQ